MKKKYIIIPVIVALIAAISAGIFFLSKGKKIEATNYNLLFISLDTLRADHVGIYGSEDADTPILDSLARKGVMFKNCYTPVPLTLPAHCTMFTGKYPISLNVRGNGIYALDGKEKTLAEIMKESGYSTYGVISSFVLLAKFGLNQGFDVYDDSLNSHKMYNNYNSEIDAPEVYQKFNQWFDKNHDSRFFAWVHLYDPHKPYKAPPEFRKKFNNSQIGRYKAEISYTDHYVGKFIDKLKEKNVLKNTLVVIVGDHGEAFGEHEEHEHGIFCYEEVLKVPLIFYNPDLLSGGLCVENRVNLIDIMPTLLDLFKLKIPAGTQGLSFYNLLRGKKEETPRTFYFESMHGKDEMNWAPLTGIIDGKYKYISLPEPELYDLETDIMEKENLFWKRNREAKDLDKKLLQLVTEYSKAVVDTRRDLTDEDKKHLQTLGYVSSFSDKSNKDMDPKKGIVLDNKIKKAFKDIAEKNFAGAERGIDELWQQENRMPIFYDLQLQYYIQRNEERNAVRVLKEALQTFPKIERFYIMYALRVFDRGEIEEAGNSVRKLLKLNPRFTRAYIMLGQIDEKNGNVENAVNNYKKALELEPQNISLKLKYAELIIEGKEFKRALQIYDELMERDEISGNAQLMFKVGLFNSRYGTMEKAEHYLRRAVSLKSKGQYYFNFALVLSKNGKRDEALRTMETLLKDHSGELNEKQSTIAKQAVEVWKKQL